MVNDLTGKDYTDLMKAFLEKNYARVFQILSKVAADNFGSSKIQSMANMTPATLVHRIHALTPTQDAALSTVLHIIEGRPL